MRQSSTKATFGSHVRPLLRSQFQPRYGRSFCCKQAVQMSAAATAGADASTGQQQQLPKSYKQVVAKGVAHSFREAAKISEVTSHQPGPDEAVIKVAFAGVNGGCETFRARGEFAFAGNKDKHDFALGAEGSGIVVACGENVKNVKEGQAVTFVGGAFSEYSTVSAAGCWPVREASPEAACLAISGLTAIGALEGTGQMKKGQTVLITAAAGATGHIGAQLAVLAGCTTIATCGGPKKVAALKKLGVQHIIDYKSEDVGEALTRICPDGLDIVYEGVGGDLRKTILPFLKPDGCMLCVGTVEHGKQRVYGSVWPKDRELLQKLKERLFDLYYSGKLEAWVDPAKFHGVESVTDAMDFMLSGQALGKVVISF
ncbi:hypothetical protein WJX84_001807 [Apatococcus fuscideae]|uniref:Enoyl reductase (ER) domain-containing protein n=1 Tax=Apatococcus fuscideae TaxID=2026836 RepID=A0AAW1T0P4_9CHLO